MDAVVVEQFVPASRAAVRAAFLDADELARWWWPQLPNVTYAIDPHPGGRYRIRTDTVGFGVHGEILTLGDRAAVVTWVWEDGRAEGPEETVTITFDDVTQDDDDDSGHAAAPAGTRVTVHHVCAGRADELRQGWTDTLARLPELFGRAGDE